MKTFKDVMEGLKVIGAGTATIALAGAAVGNWKDIQFVDPFSSTESLSEEVRPEEAEGAKAGSGFTVVLVNAQPPSRRQRSQLHNLFHYQ
ncbi:hypothetical protein L1987_88399 [Smallanthus sonchifolius]|nr:hypothetical protein L1987_88399 [Smallanthus sonchifolius]